MQVLVTFRHMEATPALRRYAETKVRRIHKLMRRPIEAHVVLEVNKRRHIAEITLSGEHLHVTAKEATGDLYSAIDLVMDKVERQIRRRVEKRLAQRHDGVPPPAAATRTRARRAILPPVARQRVVPPLLTLAEATRRIAGDDAAPFLLFRDEKSDALRLLYRRADGSLALLIPETDNE